MRKFCSALIVAATLGAGTVLSGPAQAWPTGPLGALGAAADELNMIQDAAYVWGGKSYCWYDEGWNGPGWYWCGYALRSGLGWGGVAGWRGWRHGPARRALRRHLR